MKSAGDFIVYNQTLEREVEASRQKISRLESELSRMGVALEVLMEMWEKKGGERGEERGRREGLQEGLRKRQRKSDEEMATSH